MASPLHVNEEGSANSQPSSESLLSASRAIRAGCERPWFEGQYPEVRRASSTRWRIRVYKSTSHESSGVETSSLGPQAGALV
jgi:hypothetical protein